MGWVGRQTPTITIDFTDKMMKLRLEGKKGNLVKDEDGLRSSGFDLNEKASMPKELSLCSTWD